MSTNPHSWNLTDLAAVPQNGVKRGVKPWAPTDEERRLVEHYVTLGYTQEQVGALMDKSVDCLAKHCRRELDYGALQVNAKIGGKLFQKAMGGDTAALIFWCKTRMGWSEKQLLEHSGLVPVTFNFNRQPDAE